MRTNTRFTRSAMAAALIVAFAAVSSTAIAGTDTGTLSVTATVSASCTVDSTTAVAFGTYDPVTTNASADLTTSSGAISTTCTNGSDATITLGQGNNADTGSTDTAPLRRMVGATNGEFLSYSLCQDSITCATPWGNDAGTGEAIVGSGTSDAVTVYGSVPQAQNVKADSYSDDVVVTVTF
ncbi:MAG: Csu type fimbrial protein [Rhodanobacter sp.]